MAGSVEASGYRRIFLAGNMGGMFHQTRYVLCVAAIWLLAGCGKTQRKEERAAMQPGVRLSFEDSGRRLQQLGLTDGGMPRMPSRRPRFDDEDISGVSFFRTLLANTKLDDLTLPRTYFGKSEINAVSFRNTDLSESTLCWNDFKQVDFTDADLSKSDLRAAVFKLVKFVQANLADVDLRHSSFEQCDFTRAKMGRAKLTRKQGQLLSLSDEQRHEIDWQESDGEEPPGG